MTVASRRAVLRQGVLGALAIGGSTLLQSPAEARTSLRQLGWRRGGFESRVGQTFRLVGSSGSVKARLIAVHDLRASARAGDARAFSLLLKARRRLPGGQGLFRLHAASGHTLDAFVAPVDRGASANYLQIVVNQRIPAHAANLTGSHT